MGSCSKPLRDRELRMTQGWEWNDGGRAEAGFRGSTHDCVTRAVGIATEKNYREVYTAFSKESRCDSRAWVPRKGIDVRRKWFKEYMNAIGWTWVPTMGIGTGCSVHLRADELPRGRLVVLVSKHYTTMIDGVVHDRFDPSRNGKRCVYGYWMKEGKR